jgi:hypothetical protein
MNEATMTLKWRKIRMKEHETLKLPESSTPVAFALLMVDGAQIMEVSVVERVEEGPMPRAEFKQ